MCKLYSLIFFLVSFNCIAQKRAQNFSKVYGPKKTDQLESLISQPKVPVVKGIIRNIPDSLKNQADLLSLRLNTLDVDGYYERPIKLSATGTFTFKPDYAWPLQKIELVIGELSNKSIYISKDQYVDIDFDKLANNKPGTVIYKGADASLNNFIDRYNQFKNNYNYKTRLKSRIDDLLFKDTLSAGFIPGWLKLKRETDSLQASYFATDKSSARYGWIINNELLTEQYASLLSFHANRNLEFDDSLWVSVNKFYPQFLNQHVPGFYKALQNYVVSKRQKDINLDFGISRFEALLKHNDTKETDKPAIKEALYLLDSFFKGEKAGTSTQEDAENLNKKANAVLKSYDEFNKTYIKIFNEKLQRQTYYDYLRQNFKSNRADILIAQSMPNLVQAGIDKFNEDYTRVIPQIKSTVVQKFMSSYVARINKLPVNVNALAKTVTNMAADNLHYSYNKTTLTNGMVLYNNDRPDGISIFKQLTADYKGKVLLIDMWGTWCQPCIDSFTESTQLRAKTDSNVVFIYLCNTSPKKDWMMRVAKHNLQGINIWLTQKQTAQMEKIFKLTGYPSYLIVDRVGKIHYDADARKLSEASLKGNNKLNELAKTID